MKEKADIPIIGVVRPGAVTAVNATKNKRIGIIATEGTVGSGIYPKVIHEYDPEIQVVQKACPLFVSLVEEGWTDDPVTDEVARRYLKSLADFGCGYTCSWLYPLSTAQKNDWPSGRRGCDIGESGL